MHLSQKKYIQDLLKRTKMEDAKPLPTPMTSGLQLLSKKGVPIENCQECRSVVGVVQFITITRPEICFSVNKVCQYMQNPLDTYWKAVNEFSGI